MVNPKEFALVRRYHGEVQLGPSLLLSAAPELVAGCENLPEPLPGYLSLLA